MTNTSIYLFIVYLPYSYHLSNILNKIDEFFRLQKEKGNIRDIDTRILAINCFSVIFQSIVLRKIYHNAEEIDTEHYSNTFLDILYDGIKP